MGHKSKKNKLVKPEVADSTRRFAGVLGLGRRRKWLILSILLIVLANAAFIFWIKNRSSVNVVKQEISQYPLIDPARSLIEQKYFFSTIEPVRQKMKEIVAKYEVSGNRIGVYFEFLNTGANVSINQDKRFWPASLSKMPTIFVVMKKVEEGKWKLSNEMVLFSEDKDERFGELYKQPTGTKFTIEELIRETLINSDNTSHKILVRNLSSEDYTNMFEALGMEELFNKEYNITAKEYSRIFRSLYNASYLKRDNSQQVLKWLSDTKFDEFLGAGIPDEVLFSHKIGEEFKEVVFLDSGIVYVPNKPYLITVMVEVEDNGGAERAKEIMKELSTTAYDYVANN
jgi:beta-lactamase class A